MIAITTSCTAVYGSPGSEPTALCADHTAPRNILVSILPSERGAGEPAKTLARCARADRCNALCAFHRRTAADPQRHTSSTLHRCWALHQPQAGAPPTASVILRVACAVYSSIMLHHQCTN